MMISPKYELLLVWMIQWAFGWWPNKTWVGVRWSQRDRSAYTLCSLKSVSNIKLNIILMSLANLTLGRHESTTWRTEPRRLLTLVSGYTLEEGKWSSLPVELFKLMVPKYSKQWHGAARCFCCSMETTQHCRDGKDASSFYKQDQRGRGNPYGLIAEAPLHIVTPPPSSPPWWAWLSEELSPKATGEQPQQLALGVLLWYFHTRPLQKKIYIPTNPIFNLLWTRQN